MKPVYQIKEYGSFITGKKIEGYITLPPHIFEQLETFILTNRSKDTDALELMGLSARKGIGKVITAKNYVGIITLSDGTTIEILPKIFSAVEDDAAGTKTKRLLVEMLKTLRDSPYKSLQTSSVNIEKMNIFTPYYALDSEQDKEYRKLKFKCNYEKDCFCEIQKALDYDSLEALMKLYHKNLGVLDKKPQKTITGVAVAAVATIATGGLAWAFAPQIAVALAGGSFIGLHGAALTSASLAAIGGGSLAVGGLGMAGGTAIIAGGGALLGVAGSGAASLSKEFFIEPKSDYPELFHKRIDLQYQHEMRIFILNAPSGGKGVVIPFEPISTDSGNFALGQLYLEGTATFKKKE